MPRTNRPDAADLNAFINRFRYCVGKAGGAREIEEKTEISESSIRTYIYRKAEPPRDVLLAVAKEAKVNPAWLLTGAGSPGLPLMSELKSSSPEEAVIECAAKAYGVLPQIARARLQGSTELSALENALRQADDVIQLYEAVTNTRWGQLQRRTLAAILGYNFSFSPLVARCEGDYSTLGLGDGDWAVIDPTAPLMCGLLCVQGDALTPEIVRANLTDGLKPVIKVRGRQGFPSDENTRFGTLEELSSRMRVVGRVVGMIRLQANATVE